MRTPFWTSSVGKKYLVSVTGLILFGFTAAHMLGNLQVFLGRDVLNDYAEHLASLPALLWPARAILLVSLVLHVFLAIRLSMENRAARPVPYGVRKSAVSTPAARTMLVTGAAVFFFVVYHLLHFTFGTAHPQYFKAVDVSGRHDVYTMVVASFQNPWIAGCYVIAMIFLCIHLSHGVGSLFQSVGLSDERQRRVWKLLARTSAGLIFAGNTAIVAACFFGWLKLPGRIG